MGGLASLCLSEEQYEEKFLQEETVSQHVNSIELLQTQPLAPPELVRPQQPIQRQVSLRSRPASKPAVIRGITYYKAQDPEDENDIEEQREWGQQGWAWSGSHGLCSLSCLSQGAVSSWAWPGPCPLGHSEDDVTVRSRSPACPFPGPGLLPDTRHSRL